MAGAAGRRNILRELNEHGGLSASAITPSSHNVSLPLTPTSPEEEVIKLRGRRKIVQFNPDASPIKLPGRNSPKRTPTKKIGTPTKLPATPIRCSPRKRLNLALDGCDFDEAAFEEMAISSRRVKRQKVHNLSPASAPFEKGIMALSHAQLVELVSSAAKTSSDIKKVLEELVPVPDLLPLEKRLYFFQRNIFKAYPRNIWGSQDDSYCYLRVRTHIDTFKKECMDQCRYLMESEHWPAVLEYVLTAMSYAKGLPKWATAAHNKSKEFCIRQLAANFLAAIKNANLSRVALTEVAERLKELDMPDELNGCYEQAIKLLDETV